MTCERRPQSTNVSEESIEAVQSEQTLEMTPEEQLAFWNALNAPVELTPSQRKLGKVMRGEL